MNVVCVTGQLTQEPELRPQSEAPHACALHVAVPRRAPGGFRETGVVYVEVLVIGGLAARDWAERLTRGNRIAVFGALDSEVECGEDGRREERQRVVADAIETLDPATPR
ncbi:MAG TPA: single-stranded DNA-binding protein [Thermoleophilaceae bacterium]|nr:single-stranded DNA-binding protein [Thermoleophilaceae bacterium]